MAFTNQFPCRPILKETEWKIIDDVPVKISTIIVHEFSMGDVEDPDLYAAEPLWNWQQSESGKWVMEHSVEQPKWHRQTDLAAYGYRYYITAQLKEKDELFFKLKFK